MGEAIAPLHIDIRLYMIAASESELRRANQLTVPRECAF